MKRLLFAIALLLSASGAHADIRHVWAVNDGEKVERDAVEHPLRARNSAWDGKVVRISGARNEIVAFQVIVEADGRGIRALSLRLPSLASPADRITYKPPAPDPTDYVGRPIQIFGVNYMHVTSSSHASWVYRRGSPAAPADPTGWKPVQLVPENARAGRGGFPIAVAANQNQAIWVEVYIDRVRKPGRYRGTIEIRADAARRTAPDRARGLRLRPARRKQHARDAVLLQRSGGAVSGPEPRSRLPPSRASSSRRAGPCLRRADDPERMGPILGDGLHARPRVRGAGRRRRQRHRAAHVLRPRP